MERPKPFRFTINDYERILEKGILARSERAEFIQGELFCILPTSEPHNACKLRLHSQFSQRVSNVAKIIGDVPIRLADSAPRPDLALLKPESKISDSRMPSQDDVLLVIEVADETLEYDREVKRAIYAENGISEYWIVNLINNCVEVYRDPRPNGTFAAVQTLEGCEAINLTKLPGVTVNIVDIVG